MAEGERKATGRVRSSVLVKMVLFVAGLSVVTAGSTGWASYVVARGIIREQIHERLRIAAADRHAMVLSFVAQQLERVGLVASRTRLRTLIAQYRLGEIAKEKFLDEALPILVDARKSTVGFRAISIANLNGIVIASTDPSQLDRNVAQDSTFKAGLNGRHLGEPALVDGVHVATLSERARNNAGELVGVVLVEFDATPLFEILSNTLGLGASGEFLIGTRDGQNVRYLFDEKRDTSRSKTLNDLPAMAAAIGGATRSEVLEYDGVESIVHYRPIEYQPLDFRPWGLLAKIDLSEAYVPLDEYRRALLWIQSCLFVVGLAGSFWLSRRLTRPIVALTETAMAVTAGDLAAQVTVTTDDEIGVLSRTFNAMTRQLQMSYATLEEQVARRTSELRDEIARREEIQQELQQNAERIQRIIDTANDAFITMDSAGKIIEWNPQARTMFGWSRDEVLDMSLADTIARLTIAKSTRVACNDFWKLARPECSIDGSS